MSDSGNTLVWGRGLSSYNTESLNMDSIGYIFGKFHPSYMVNTFDRFRKRIGALQSPRKTKVFVPIQLSMLCQWQSYSLLIWREIFRIYRLSKGRGTKKNGNDIAGDEGSIISTGLYHNPRAVYLS